MRSLVLVLLALGALGCSRYKGEVSADPEGDEAALKAKVKAMREQDEAARNAHPAESARPVASNGTTWGPRAAEDEADRAIASAHAKDADARRKWAASVAAKSKMKAEAIGAEADTLYLDSGGCPLVAVAGFRSGDVGQEAQRLGFKACRMNCGHEKVCVIQLDSGAYECH